jgi:GT2 family glycosyltransferase
VADATSIDVPSARSIGIVTVLYNSEEVLDDFFASLARQDERDFKLYVIDNSSNADGIDKARRLAERYRIDSEMVFNASNVGVAKGNNQGIAMALHDGCKFVLLANNDTDFGANTLSALLLRMQFGVPAVTPKILYHGPGNLVWYAGGRIDAWTMRVPHIGMRCADYGQFDASGYTAYAPTCFMLLDATVFDRVGVMDERYFVYYDDTDFVWRMTKAGVRILYVPEAVVLHKVSTSTGGERSTFSLYYSSRNRIYFIRKNLRGLQRVVALSYVLLTRAVNSMRLPRPLARHLWAGVKDGFRLSLPASSD